MQLEKISGCNDIKKLNLIEKKELSQEIRDFLIKAVAKTGGHLASNLGVVELTIALESVFDVTKDKIIWDVGHQSYVHKILTGRKEAFSTMRQLDGISGFPKTSESKTDCFNTGHSSTSISAAMGMAKARDLSHKDYSVIAVIGDGALTGGMALEALNHVGCTRTKLIIILNDNEMSISKNISGVNKLLTGLRSRTIYRRTNSYGKKFVSSIPIVGKAIVHMVETSKSVLKQLIIPKMYFEQIGINYLGPVDGHDIDAMQEIFNNAKNFDEPVLIHVITKKGKGYLPAEINPAKFHGIGPFDVDTGELKQKSGDSYSKIFGAKLVQLAKHNKKIVAITAAMRDGVGMTEFSKHFPNRFFDVGIAEQHALTFAAGLAKGGMIPFVSIYSSFYQRAYDQVIHDICAQRLPVIMCVDRAGIVGADGETHQGIYDLSFFKIIPNITIMAPSDYNELREMMELAINLKAPVVIRYPRGGECTKRIVKHLVIKSGRAEIIKTGSHATILGIGNTVSKTLEIADKLENDNISAEVINVRFLKPIDSKTIIKSIIKTKNVVVLEDNTQIGGLSSSIKELIIDSKINDVQLLSFAYPDEFISHGSIKEIENKYKLDINSITKKIKNTIK